MYEYGKIYAKVQETEKEPAISNNTIKDSSVSESITFLYIINPLFRLFVDFLGPPGFPLALWIPSETHFLLSHTVACIYWILFYFNFSRISSALIPLANSFFRTDSASAFFVDILYLRVPGFLPIWIYHHILK